MSYAVVKDCGRLLIGRIAPDYCLMVNIDYATVMKKHVGAAGGAHSGTFLVFCRMRRSRTCRCLQGSAFPLGLSQTDVRATTLAVSSRGIATILL